MSDLTCVIEGWGVVPYCLSTATRDILGVIAFGGGVDSYLANVVLAAFKSVCVAALQLCGRLLYTPGSLCSPGAANVAPAAAGFYLV